MGTLQSVDVATFTEAGETKEGINFTWTVRGATEKAARIRARMLTAKAFPLQWANEFEFPPLRLVESEKIDESIIEPRPIGVSGLIKTWKVTLFMPTENDLFDVIVEDVLNRAENILNRGSD